MTLRLPRPITAIAQQAQIRRFVCQLRSHTQGYSVIHGPAIGAVPRHHRHKAHLTHTPIPLTHHHTQLTPLRRVIQTTLQLRPRWHAPTITPPGPTAPDPPTSTVTVDATVAPPPTPRPSAPTVNAKQRLAASANSSNATDTPAPTYPYWPHHQPSLLWVTISRAETRRVRPRKVTTTGDRAA